MESGINVLAARSNYAIGVFDDVLFQLWRKESPPAEGARLVLEAVEALGLRRRRVHLFIVLHAGLKPPEKEARQILTSLGRDPRIRSCAFVTSGGSSFWAATMRAVLNSMVFLTRPTFDVKTFSDLDLAAAWTSSHLDSANDQVLHALGELERAAESSAP